MSAHLRSAEHPMIRGYVQEMVYATVIRVIVMIDIQVILRLQTILVQLYGCLNVIRPTQFFPIYLQDRTVRNVKRAGTHVKNCELALSVYFSKILQGYRKNQKMR